MAEDLNKLNIYDKVLGYFSPKAGLSRLGLRSAYNLAVKRSYEAATKGRRGKSFKGADDRGPNITLAIALTTLRQRSRHLINNNGWAKRAQGVICANVIGEGIRPAPVGTRNQVKRIKTFWKEWAESTACDWYGKNTFYGLQELIMREIVEAGDCLVIRRRVNSRIPIQLQVLQGDQLDHSVNSINEKGFARLGVQYNSEGKIIGYWCWTQHPNDMMVNYKLQSEFISAEDVIHPFEILRAGQSRGLPMGVAGFMKLSDFSDYEIIIYF
ncbi:MAG: phage portal protein [Prevotella sp.]|jgi:lambda family phage portal protein|nr:phage portal protein [Prevotella sp.]